MSEKIEPTFAELTPPSNEKGPEGQAEGLGAPGEEITPELKLGAIKRYIEASSAHFFINLGREGKEIKDFFSDFRPGALEKILGESALTSAFLLVNERERLLCEMKGNGVEIDQIQEFIKRRGSEMLPYRACKALIVLNDSRRELDTILRELWRFSQKKEPQSWREVRKEAEHKLQSALEKLEQELQEWQKYGEFERQNEERPIKIGGFEEFDLSTIKGCEIIEKALSVLPGKALSINIESLDYDSEAKEMPPEYGFSGVSAGQFVPGEERHRIRLFRDPKLKTSSPSEKLRYLENALFVIVHEYGHSLDPRIVDQKDLSPGKQLQMITDWEEVRSSEKEWSSYVKKISNDDKVIEELLKSQESFAESVALYLARPDVFIESYPVRHAFLARWFKERFPGFDLGQIFREGVDYCVLIKKLKEKESPEQ